MAWPINLNHVHCEGFSRALLPAIKDAVESRQVVWTRDPSLFAESCHGWFSWAGCEWMLAEITELVVAIEHISGDLNSEDLTVAVLACKINT